MGNKVPKYRYSLEEGSKKHRCPSCNKKRFVRYVDRETDDYLPKKYGRCDREGSCDYFLNPYQDGFTDGNIFNRHETGRQSREPPPTNYVPYEVFKASLKAYNKNRFVLYLQTLFGYDIVRQLICKYYIGSSKYWPGSTVFWQLDKQKNIRSGKVMLYGKDGYRVKEPYSHINWAHSLLYEDYNLDQCLFGEHLLTNDKTIPVAIVESEKTAIICSAYFPEFTWLATGALHNLKPEKGESLMGRRVVLFPDIGAYDDWQQKMADLSYFCDMSISDMLENHAAAEAKKEGHDLADYLITYELSKFRNLDNSSF